MVASNSCQIIEMFEEGFFENLARKVYTPLQLNSDIKSIEIFTSASKTTKINFESGFVKNANQKKSAGIALRIIDSFGREGMTFTSDFSDSALEMIMHHGVKMMKAATKNPEFRDIAHPSPSSSYISVSNIYDPILEDICPEEINEIIQPIFALKSREKTPQGLSGGFAASIGGVYIWNSNGVSIWDKFSTASVSAEVSVVENNIPSGGFDWVSACQLKDVDVEKVANTSYNMAIRGLTKSSLKTGMYPVVLSPLATAYFLIDPLTTSINAERVQNQMSFLGDYLNKPLGDKSLNISDDPHIPGKLGTESFDAEGVATKPLTIIKNGILEAFYHNTFTAGKEQDCESNGHASRGSYNSPLGISNNNLIMEPGSKNWENIVADIKKGIYLEYSGDSPDYITGDFSGLIMTGYIIDEGVIGPAVSETMMGINIIEAFSKIEEISRERKWIDEAFVPWVKISEMKISSRN
ncbi:MAG: TldD/PmbA family protein [Promethearchaeota archaeon]